MKTEHIREIKAICFLAFGMILLASLVSFIPQDLPWYTSQPNIPAKNLIRIAGAYMAGSLFFVWGNSAYVLVLFLMFWSWNKFTQRDINFTVSKLFASLVLMAVASSFFSQLGPLDSVDQFSRGGMIGLLVTDFLNHYLGVGTYVVLFMLGILSLIIIGEFLVSPLVLRFINSINDMIASWKDSLSRKKGEPKTTPFKRPQLSEALAKFNELKNKVPLPATIAQSAVKEEVLEKNEPAGQEESDPAKPNKPRIKIASENKKSSAGKQEPQIVGQYTIPSLDLLDVPPQISSSKIESGLMTGAKLLEETLTNFGVNARVADIERGPAITRYELEPAPGVKVTKITTLSDDIALAMRASSVRIVAPIPGKNRIGIEVPNDASASVFLKDVLSSDEFKNAESKLTLSLGKDIAGKPMVADLADMPHLLIAGTTGSGKTVCVNGIIMSILLNASPDEVRFVMVDPKMVELAQYNDIPHLLCPTVTDTKKASAVLNWVVGEMESRYKKLSAASERNIKGYNAKCENMPYIVVIIDELADLMQVSAKGVEGAITRLAQLSRAVGIHLILATQRPSVNVITGVIKANFPARISFKVASKVDSRTVLDVNGAESLLGKGDMLFMKPGDAKPIRGQGNFVKDAEIKRVIQFIKDQQEPIYDEKILQSQSGQAREGVDQKDEYFDEAVKMVLETNQASVSILQRRLRLGYTRAARLIDMMEVAGIVGPYVGSKPRDILVDREQWLLKNMEKGNAKE